MAAVWPVTLPTRFQAQPGVVEQPPNVTIETAMDAGPPKMRRRFTAGDRIVQGALALTRTQRATLDTFFMDTLAGGSLSFDWIHPITGAPATMRFLQQPDGLRYKQGEPDGVDLIVAEMQLRILP